MMLRLRKILDCDSRVFWFGEDENANIAIVGALCFVVQPDGQVTQLGSWKGDTVAFVNGRLVSTESRATGVVLRTDGDNVGTDGENLISLPIAEAGLYESLYIRSTQSAFLLGKNSLVHVNMATRNATTVDTWSDGEFECVAAAGSLVAVFRYGLRVYDIRSFRLVAKYAEYNDRFYWNASLDSDVLVACDLDGHLDIIQVNGDAAVRSFQIEGTVTFIAVLEGTPVAVYRKGPETYCCCIIGDAVVSTFLGSFDCEGFAIIDNKYVGIGNLYGELLLWDVRGGKFDSVKLKGRPRITKMFWSDRRRELFVGTRHGPVYSSRES